MKNKIKRMPMGYFDFPTFEEFINQKRLIQAYNFFDNLMEIEVTFSNREIIVNTYIYDETSNYNNKIKRLKVNEKSFNLSSKGYLKAKLYLLDGAIKTEFSNRYNGDWATTFTEKELKSIYDQLDELKEALIKEGGKIWA